MAHSYQVFLNRPVTYPKDIRRVAIIANPVSGGKLGRTIATKIQHELLVSVLMNTIPAHQPTPRRKTMWMSVWSSPKDLEMGVV